jgi:hypothetical protein
MKRTLEERFWAMVSKDCWLWRGSIKPRNGYGHFRDGKKDFNAHRLAYELTYGPIPAGLEVMHTCDAPACVNPAHLKLGTHDENMQDCKRKGRYAKGESAYHAKLTEEQVRYIRANYRKTGPRKGNGKELSEKFNISRTVIYQIAAGETWSHLK